MYYEFPHAEASKCRGEATLTFVPICSAVILNEIWSSCKVVLGLAAEWNSANQGSEL